MNIRSVMKKQDIFDTSLALIVTQGLHATPMSQIAQEAFQLAETIKQAYLENNQEALESNATQDGYTELIGAIKNFDSAELEFVPTWVEIDDTVVKLTVSWKGTWNVSDFTKDNRGIAVFVMEGQPLKLASILRANPFRQPE